MTPHPNLPFQLHLPAPSATQAAALLNALDDPGDNCDALLDLTLETPALIIALLWMRPLRAEDTSLRSAIEARLSVAGAPLVRAWVLQGGGRSTDDTFVTELSLRSLDDAHLAAELARQSGSCTPFSAELAGLWLGAGELSLASSVPHYAQMLEDGLAPGARLEMEQENLGADHLQLSARLAAECGLGVDIQDALLLSHLTGKRLEGAHPLARTLHCARTLAGNAPDLELTARLTGLPTEALAQLANTARVRMSNAMLGHAGKTYPVVAGPWRTTVLAALTSEMFAPLDAQVGEVLSDAFRLLFATPAPLLLIEENGVLRPMLTATDTDTTALADRITELHLGADDPSSVIALAVRSQAITTQYVGRETPTRSVKDWHLARWLGHRSLACLPFDVGGARGVGIMGVSDAPAAMTQEHRLMAQLVSQAARSHFQHLLVRTQMDAHGEQVRDELMDHVRRVKHEVAGPLTVLQTQLSLIADQAQPDDAPVSISEVSREVSRIRDLLATLTEPTHVPANDGSASINAEVSRLVELYGHALFDHAGRHLDVRLPPHLPQVAISPKALTQVLLNLMRNASEALPEGGSLSIRSSGVAITGGRPCVEILLKDDGPGLPVARQRALFDPAPSGKGGDHDGVGLSIVKQLLDDHDAYIFCRTIKNQGTSFQIYIPVLDC